MKTNARTSCSWVFCWSAACLASSALASSAICLSLSSLSASSLALFLSCSSSRARRVCSSSSVEGQTHRHVTHHVYFNWIFYTFQIQTSVGSLLVVTVQVRYCWCREINLNEYIRFNLCYSSTDVLSSLNPTLDMVLGKKQLSDYIQTGKTTREIKERSTFQFIMISMMNRPVFGLDHSPKEIFWFDRHEEGRGRQQQRWMNRWMDKKKNGYLSELSSSDLRSVSASAWARLSPALSSPSLSLHTLASSSHSPAEPWEV